jgi:cell fate (sporulation/competence/biofilm development) regulator YmcA (YheA/YmcA/DUF963 family)
MDNNSNLFSNDTNSAWVLNDDDWSRAWMDEELALQRQQTQVRSGALTIIGISEVQVNQQLSKTDSEGSYQRKFGKKRRPSLYSERTKPNKNKSIRYNAPLFSDNIDYVNDDDNNTISTLSTASLLMDDRDAMASSNSIRDESSRQDETDVEEIDRVVENMLYKCNITVIERPPPLQTEKMPSSKRKKSIKSDSSTRSPEPVNVTTMLAPPKIRKNRSMTSKSKSTTSKKKRSKKTVTFHKYDKVIHTSNKMEYVFSLYHDEVEREKQEYDVVDELETAVNDVGYFFQCLQQSISEDVSTKLGRTKTTKHR